MRSSVKISIVVAALVLVGAAVAGGLWSGRSLKVADTADNAAFAAVTPGSQLPATAVSAMASPATSQAVAPLATATEAVLATATTVLGSGSLPAVERDVPYCSAGGVSLLMDVYRPPAQASSPAPAVLYVHGGGWTSGDKSVASKWAGLLARQGFLVASINYRLAPQYKWPAQIEDTECAVRYLRAKAANYNIDPNRIGAIGDSAGGHLVSLLGLAGAGAGFAGNGGYADRQASVQAVVDMYGPTDFTAVDLRTESLRIAQVLGIPLAEAPDVLRKASPVTYVRKDAPPFLIIQGDKDTLVLPDQSQELYDRLKAAGADADLLMVKNAGHAFAPTGGAISPTLLEIGQKINLFFMRTLMGRGSGS